jgi:hypothetical protein
MIQGAEREVCTQRLDKSIFVGRYRQRDRFQEIYAYQVDLVTKRDGEEEILITDNKQDISF